MSPKLCFVYFSIPVSIRYSGHNLPRLEKRLPNRAPNKDKLAIHEPCCSVIVRCGKCGENDGILLSLWLSFWGNKDAKAGDV